LTVHRTIGVISFDSSKAQVKTCRSTFVIAVIAEEGDPRWTAKTRDWSFNEAR